MFLKICLIVILFVPSLSFASLRFSYDYNVITMADNSGNVALGKNISAVSMTDSSTVGDAATGMSFSLGYEKKIFLE